jgi:CRISPR-associated protein Csx3
MYTLPAIAIGGPPHSGKSVLTYSLTQLLRSHHHRVEHYVLRACPDGEGDWSNETTPERVLAIRQKGKFTDSFITNVCTAIQSRHLPLLVDVGGAPTIRDEAIFRCCTHLIILSKSREEMALWRALAERTGLPILAEIDSALTGEEAIYGAYPILTGRLTHLERGTTATGRVIEQLAGLVSTLFATKEEALRQLHLKMAPTELAVDLDRVATQLHLKKEERWQPDDLPALLHYLPPQTPQAIYGRGTVWLYAALAHYIHPAPFYQFDPRLGWVEPVRLVPTTQPATPWLTYTVTTERAYSRLFVKIPDTYLDYERMQDCPIPILNLEVGLILDGKLPYWLFCGLARAYAPAAWLAIHQPPLHGAVVVASRVADYPLGALLPL